MISDESSSDSETGRFKCRTKNQEEQSKPHKREEHFRTSDRSRPQESNRFNRESHRNRESDRSRDSYRNRELDRGRDIDKNRDIKDRFERHNRDRNRHSRQSPLRRRHTPEKSSSRKSHERFRSDRDAKSKTVIRERSKSKDERRDSRPRSNRSPDRKRDLKDEIKRNIEPKETKSSVESIKAKSKEKSPSPDLKAKRSEVFKPPALEVKKRKSESPIIVEEHSDESEVVQPGSYYSLIPAVVKEKSEEESTEIDSSDDEKLRAKLLNLEKELHKTKKKKHKKKHRKKRTQSRDKEQDTSAVVEVTSTTDIKDEVKNEKDAQQETVEVSSTQKNNKDSGEEGEILSDDDSQSQYENDPNDLRHKLKQSVVKVDAKKDVCGPALPPHLETRYHKRDVSMTEGPVLPPHFQKKSRNLGPSIPDDMRKILSEKDCEFIKSESSEDEGIGPIPADSEGKMTEAHRHLEERALDMKIRKLEGNSLQKSDVKSREEWMLELPEGKAKYLGLEKRTFRAKAGPDMSDRSSWTDTPEEKARKAAGVAGPEDPEVTLKREARARQISSRDTEQEEAVKKHKKKHKRDESLLEMHEKKLKKKKKKEDKEEGKKERRPFSRDVDLEVNRFDEAQKRSIIKKSQQLDSRFSRGEAKYL